MEGNQTLRQKIDDLGLTYAEVARRVNAAIRELTGRYGTCSERRVKAWTSGATRWPHEKQRIALEAVFGCPAEMLGFVPRTQPRPPAPVEPSSVHRRTLLASGPAALATSALPRPARTSLGTADVLRLRQELEDLTALDDHHGGHDSLERNAVAGAQRALAALEGASASERVRARVLGVAADYYGLAGWSAIDAHQLPRAQAHLDVAMRLSGLAQDPAGVFRAWNGMALLARHRGAHLEAVAAAKAARSTGAARSDAAFRSLAHARTAVGYAYSGERQAALRALGLAGEALAQAEARARPSWMAFYDWGELHALSSIVLDRIGSPAEAERSSHQALALVPAQFRRNRAHAMIRLALTQLHQDEPELAAATAGAMLDLMRGDALPGRLRSLLGDFHRSLLALSPGGAAAREWADRYRAEWSRP
ncbi:XRE family transcriptional regulator [Kitasatospora sp. NPDC001540]|uniref:XRE family transcriptional regulator n=1 Tax=Kitasatospora sp. NPDC001540 TaxID=3364014 RepID=UPI00368C72DA